MRLPFLSPSPVLVEYRLALAEAQARAEQERAERIAAQDAAERKYAALLEKYHALRSSGYAVPDAFVPPSSPMASLGLLTQAALREMSVGLPASNRRAMTDVALALTGEGMADEQVALRVKRGEPVRDI